MSMMYSYNNPFSSLYNEILGEGLIFVKKEIIQKAST